jgi:hypothetical protein
MYFSLVPTESRVCLLNLSTLPFSSMAFRFYGLRHKHWGKGVGFIVYSERRGGVYVVYAISARKSVPWKLYSYSARFTVLRYGKVLFRVLHYILKTFTSTNRIFFYFGSLARKSCKHECVSFFISVRWRK